MNTSKFIFSILVVSAITFASCHKTPNIVSAKLPKADTIHISESSWFVEQPIYNYSCEDGHKRVFYDICFGNEFGEGHYLGVQENEDSTTNHFLQLVYQRYEDVPDFFAFIGGCPAPFHYLPSPDGKTLYIVTQVYANSNGWTTEYQLFKVNCETLDAKFICDCAAIAVTGTGFVVAQARLTNRETATCTADEIWVMHDVYFDWEGRLTRISSEEYDCKALDEKYQSGEYTLIKGFYGTISTSSPRSITTNAMN